MTYDEKLLELGLLAKVMVELMLESPDKWNAKDAMDKITLKYEDLEFYLKEDNNEDCTSK